MEIGGMSTHIETGLAKIPEAFENVEKLKIDLAEIERESALDSETAECRLNGLLLFIFKFYSS